MLTSTSAALKEKDEKIEMLEVTIHNWEKAYKSLQGKNEELAKRIRKLEAEKGILKRAIMVFEEDGRTK